MTLYLLIFVPSHYVSALHFATVAVNAVRLSVKAKFHYASWFEACSKLVDLSATSFELASNQLA